MKRVLALVGAFLLVSAVQCDDMPFWNEMVECAQGMGISLDQMKSMLTSKDAQMNCVHACVLEKIGGMVDGKLSLDSLMESLEKLKAEVKDYDATKAGIHQCFDQASGDRCESAGQFAMCMQEHMQG
ncbi:hypothetical protein TSAR_000158 [Trichomalopsis sarcophagae]|uniref:Uncharacterized protein n=1 Tax=Trichomalopsis sarcophagae TaxID=543379 RepID=A0A232EWX4_9HYME|nr:hypothetical protein TSAR_000158 [Trichomalopsis sarcophagae]